MTAVPLIREIRQSEISFLDEMLYEAIYIPEGGEKLPKGIIHHPDLYRYIKDFGQNGDTCFIAELQGELIGGIWTRLFSENGKGYGYVDEKTPELSMAVYKPFRRLGIGKQLLDKMLNKLTDLGYIQVSLSVDKQNHAFDFYIKHGFKILESTDKSATMIKKLI